MTKSLETFNSLSKKLIWCATFLLVAFTNRANLLRAEEINFSKQILPLLSNNCFECHGPDKAERKAGLRLDTHEGAKMELKSGFSALVPGESSESEMYMRIISDDPEEIMPPPESSKSLTEDQKELIKKEEKNENITAKQQQTNKQIKT